MNMTHSGEKASGISVGKWAGASQSEKEAAVRKYASQFMGDLAAELSAGLRRLRKGYVDAGESLLRIIDPSGEYPCEFVVFRLTGYRPCSMDPQARTIDGSSLQGDLQQLMLDICDSFELKTDAYPEQIYDTSSLAMRFNVSTKTIQRWRCRGLVARRLLFSNNKRRLAYLDSSVQWFVNNRYRRALESGKFSQMSPTEQGDIIGRARQMADGGGVRQGDVVRRLAAQMGRAAETIRYTIRKHDAALPDQAVFPQHSPPLGQQEKMFIYHCFLRGVSATGLAKRYRRSRGSIYRIVNEMRAFQLLQRPISYVYNPQFDLPNADQVILGTKPIQRSDDAGAVSVRPPADLPPYLRSLYEAPLLTVQQEQDLFRRYNYFKHKADKLRKRLDVNHLRSGQLKRIETLLLQANAIKNQIVRANLRLVVSIAKKHVGGPQTLFELISDGNLSLMRAVEKFDYSRGFRLSTYASWAIMRNFARSVPRERFRRDRFSTCQDDILDVAASLRVYDPNEVNIPELRESIDVMLGQLTARERAILVGHYGLDAEGRTKTLDQLGRRLGLSKERVRQIEITAIKKLRRIAHPLGADMLI